MMNLIFDDNFNMWIILRVFLNFRFDFTVHTPEVFFLSFPVTAMRSRASTSKTLRLNVLSPEVTRNAFVSMTCALRISH